MARQADMPKRGVIWGTVEKEFIQRRKQEEIIDLFGTLELDENYDYKKLRNR
jgi:hypothetical protein